MAKIDADFEAIREEYKQLTSSLIIQRTIVLDALIEQVIAQHFCTDETKHLKFLSWIFRDGEITLAQKIRILKKLLKEDHPDIYKQVPSLFNRLDKIRELRNTIAHSQIASPEKEVPGINAFQYRDGKLVLTRIDSGAIKEIIDWAEGAYHVMLYIISVTNGQNSPDKNASFLTFIKRHWPTLLSPREKASG